VPVGAALLHGQSWQPHFFFTTMSMFPLPIVVANAMPPAPAAMAPIINAQRSLFMMSILDPDIA
jgi:hypothetical protein